MGKPTFPEMIAKVRLQLQDAEGNYWTDEEITDYLNEGQVEYCRKSLALRGEAPIVLKENQGTYTLPDDVIQILRVEDSDGKEIHRVDSADLQKRLGNFRARDNGSNVNDGNPNFCYADLDGIGSLRFYPRPNPTIEEGFVDVGTAGDDILVANTSHLNGVSYKNPSASSIGGLVGDDTFNIIRRNGDLYEVDQRLLMNAFDATSLATSIAQLNSYGMLNTFHIIDNGGVQSVLYHGGDYNSLAVDGAEIDIDGLTTHKSLRCDGGSGGAPTVDPTANAYWNYVNEDFSIAGWFKLNGTAPYFFLSQNSGMNLTINNGQAQFYGLGASTNVNCLLNGVTIPDDEWVLVVATWDDATGTAKLYLKSSSGSLDASQSSTDVATINNFPYAPTNLIHFGEKYDDTNSQDITIDKLSAWEKELTAEEVDELFNGGVGLHISSINVSSATLETGLVQWFDFAFDSTFSEVNSGSLGGSGFSFEDGVSTDHHLISSGNATTTTTEVHGFLPSPIGDDRVLMIWENDIVGGSGDYEVVAISGLNTGVYTATTRALTSVCVGGVLKSDQSGYYAIMADGTIEEWALDGTVDATVVTGADTALGIDYATGYLYYRLTADSLLYSYDGSTSTATSVTLSAATNDGRIIVKDSVVYWDGATYDLIDGSTITSEISGYRFDSTLTTNQVFEWGCDVYSWMNTLVRISDDGVGCCVSIDSISGICEFGAIVDFESSDNEDIVVFENEFGAVVQIIQSSVGAHLYYVRKPLEGIIEVNEPLALTHYALHKCYEKEGDQTHLQRSNYHENKFYQIIRRDKRQAHESFNNSRSPVRGYQF